MEYVRYIWDGFIEGEHHRLIADKLTEVAQGKCKRLIVNMPPRHTKSEFASVYFPSWIMGLKPDMKIMQTTHTADLSIRFGRKVHGGGDSVVRVLTTDTIEQAVERAGTKAGNKGADVAMTALEMVSVLRARGCRYCILRHLDASRPAAGFKKGGLIRWYEKHGFRLARDVLPKSLEFIDTDHMVAEVDQIYLRERAR